MCDILCKTKTKLGKIGIEIKRNKTLDFIESIKDGRYPNQIINMRNSGKLDKFIFIFIGNVKTMFMKTKFKPVSYYGAIASLQTKYGVSVNFVPSDSFAIMLSFYIFKHANLDPKTTPIFRIKVDKYQRQVSSLCCIEKVGETSAHKVLKYFPLHILKNIDDPNIIKEKCKVRISVAKSIVDFYGS